MKSMVLMYINSDDEIPVMQTLEMLRAVCPAGHITIIDVMQGGAAYTDDDRRQIIFKSEEDDAVEIIVDFPNEEERELYRAAQKVQAVR